MANVLIPTLRFPPAGGVSLRRIVKVAKELDRQGVEVHIVTTENKAQVNNYMQDVINSNLKISKIPSLSINNFIYNMPTSFLGRFLRRLVIYLTMPLYYVDFAFLWGLVLIPYLVYYIKKHNIKNVYCSGAPFSTLWHVALVKKILGNNVNYIFELRDFWTKDTEGYFAPPKALSKFIYEKMEQTVIKNADRGIVVTKGMLAEIPEAYREKMVVIKNGYDEDEIPLNALYCDKNPYHIVYTGNVGDKWRTEALMCFLESFRQLVAKNGNYTFTICGQLSYSAEKKIKTEYDDLLSAGNIKNKGVVSPKEAIDILSQAGYGLVLVQRTHPEALTSKFFEYTAAGVNVIAIGPEGELSQLMEDEKIGRYFVLDENNINNHLVEFVLSNRKASDDVYNKFRSKNSFKKIAENIEIMLLGS